MITSTILSEKFIGKDDIVKILDECGFKYVYGHNDENIWVSDNDEDAMIIEINNIDEFGFSMCDKENLEELKYSKNPLPINNPHCFTIEHDNAFMFKTVLKKIAKLDPNAFVIHETKDKYISILKA